MANVDVSGVASNCASNFSVHCPIIVFTDDEIAFFSFPLSLFSFFFCFKSVNAFIYRLSCCCCCCCCCCLVRIPHDVSSRMFIIRMCLLPVDDLWRPIPRRFRRTLISRSSASAIVAVAASMASCARPESITIQLKISQLIELIHSWNGPNQQLWGGGQHQLI